MIHKDYISGICTMTCDINGCGSEIINDGFDGKPDFMGLVDDARREGWIIRKIEGEWCHFCSKDCFIESLSQEEEN